MIVRDVKRRLQERGTATFSELVGELGVERDMVRAALEFWQRRGHVSAELACFDGGAGGCSVNCKGCSLSRAAVSRRGNHREGGARGPRFGTRVGTGTGPRTGTITGLGIDTDAGIGLGTGERKDAPRAPGTVVYHWHPA